MNKLTLLTATLLLSCSRSTPAPVSQRPTAALAPALRNGYELSARGRIVAIGDLHGDLENTRKVLRLAGVIGTQDHWIAGQLTVVQTGDTIDRGDDDRAVLDLLERLRAQASAAGGAFIALSGNHEIMNVAGDLRYVTAKSAAAFEPGRLQAFAPGGPYARVLASWPVIVKVDDTVFVHGGVLQQHVAYGIAAINAETAAWMRGERAAPSIIMQEDAPDWTRLYSADPDAQACAQLARVLEALQAKRMVVGHTPQTHGISSACDDKVWRIDTGLSHYYGGPLQLLEIESGQARIRSAG